MDSSDYFLTYGYTIDVAHVLKFYPFYETNTNN